MTSSRYGSVGWREFASNRTTILNKYDAAKQRSASRPVKTDHGVAGEAAIREWLAEFLPKKYGVTSGFIIPDVVETPGFKLYHYDIIIFDALSAPILWVDDNPDQSQQGRKRAVPARYVFSVIEVKASFGADPARDALGKLQQLNEIAGHLPSQFSSAVIFVELPDSAFISRQPLATSLARNCNACILGWHDHAFFTERRNDRLSDVLHRKRHSGLRPKQPYNSLGERYRSAERIHQQRRRLRDRRKRRRRSVCFRWRIKLDGKQAVWAVLLQRRPVCNARVVG